MKALLKATGSATYPETALELDSDVMMADSGAIRVCALTIKQADNPNGNKEVMIVKMRPREVRELYSALFRWLDNQGQGPWPAIDEPGPND